jgi:serine O-acetyltransferase
MASEVLRLFRSDYAAHCRAKNEPPRRSRALMIPRLLTNPSLQAVLMLRIGNRTPPPLRWVVRQIMIGRFAMDWTGPFEIGPGLTLPHPVGIMLGPGIRLGSNVMLTHNVSIGADAYGRGPDIGDGVHVYPGAVIIGRVTIGPRSVVGANNFVTEDVPPDSVVKRGVVEPMRESSFSRAVAAGV